MNIDYDEAAELCTIDSDGKTRFVQTDESLEKVRLIPVTLNTLPTVGCGMVIIMEEGDHDSYSLILVRRRSRP